MLISRITLIMCLLLRRPDLPGGPDRSPGPTAPKTGIAIGLQPVDAARKCWRREHDLMVARHIDRDDLRRAPVRKPQAALVPARLLAERDPLHEHLRLRQRRLLVLKRLPRDHAGTAEREKPGRRPVVPTARRHLNTPSLVGWTCASR